jgi:hypothetical protein
LFFDQLRAHPVGPFSIYGHLDKDGFHHKHHYAAKDELRSKKINDQRPNKMGKKLPIRAGYTPFANMPRLPDKMGKPPMSSMPFSLIPAGMGHMPGANPMAGSSAGKPPIKMGAQPSMGSLGMSMSPYPNPIAQMSLASNMRSINTPMSGNQMRGNPMMNPIMGMPNPMSSHMSNPMGNPMGNIMGNPMGNLMGNPMSNPMGSPITKPFPPAVDKKAVTQ